MHRSAIGVLVGLLAVGGVAGCSAEAVQDQVQAQVQDTVANHLGAILPGGLDSICATYRESGATTDGLVEVLRTELGSEDLAESLGLPVPVDDERLLRIVADQVASACG